MRSSGDMIEEELTPRELREGVRSGILASIKQDVELRGGRTARLLVAAGTIGVLGAVGLTLLVSRHPFAHHPSWHPVVFGSVWAGLLVVSFAIVFLELRTPSLPLARSALAGILALGLAGTCGAMSPDQHFMHWWTATAIGESIVAAAGLEVGALCFGLMTALWFGAISAFLVLGDGQHPRAKPLLAAVMLLILLAPGVALESVGTSLGVLAGWLVGTAAGALIGVTAGISARAHFAKPQEG